MIITELKPNEVFVFGSNASGFHGAGAAGVAYKGSSANDWRSNKEFLEALKSPMESNLRIGKWAKLGVARGYQEGLEGKSWGIVTVVKPGMKRSISRKDIYNQLEELWDYAAKAPKLTFYITPLGENLAGYTHAEMKEVWDYLIKMHGERSNCIFTFNRE